MSARAQGGATWLLLLAVLAAGLFSVHNLDIHLHATMGEWIVDHGTVPSTNVLSELHADHPTVQDKWGFALLAHGLLDGLGPWAVILARLAVLFALFGVMASTARKLGAGPWAMLLFLLLALVAARSRYTFRPDLLSLLLTALVTRAVVAEHTDGRGLLWLVPLQILWVNLHGYFITGPLVVLTVAVGRALTGPEGRAAARRLAGLALAMLLACLINPAGVDGLLHPVNILTDLREHIDFYRDTIVEFTPTFAEDPRASWDRLAFMLLGAGAAVLLVVDAFVGGARREPEARGTAVACLALLALFGLMSLSLRRNMAPFAIVVAPLAAAAASRRLRESLGGRIGGRIPGALAALPAAALCLAVVVGEASDRISVHDGLDRRFGFGLSQIAYPHTGIDFIAEELPEARVFTAFSYGSTFTGRRYPQQVASIDGNTHGYPTTFLIEAVSALSGEDSLAFDRMVARDGQTVALLPMAGPLSMRLLAHPGWALVSVGRREAVFVLRGEVDAAWLAEHDLLATLRAGARPNWPGTPSCAALMGLPRACAPHAELDQALLLLTAGLPELARERADAAHAIAPDDPEVAALRGLVALRLGEVETGRALLQQSLDAGGTNRFAAQARAALAGA
ncbi:MAG: hypothetical protein ACYTCU_10870 [Planctomycetota bacterium]|jgi:hypothetical protein